MFSLAHSEAPSHEKERQGLSKNINTFVPLVGPHSACAPIRFYHQPLWFWYSATRMSNRLDAGRLECQSEGSCLAVLGEQLLTPFYHRLLCGRPASIRTDNFLVASRPASGPPLVSVWSLSCDTAITMSSSPLPPPIPRVLAAVSIKVFDLDLCLCCPECTLSSESWEDSCSCALGDWRSAQP